MESQHFSRSLNLGIHLPERVCYETLDCVAGTTKDSLEGRDSSLATPSLIRAHSVRVKLFTTDFSSVYLFQTI